MSDKTLSEMKVDAHIAVLHTKVDSLIEKQKELTGRVRANEKVVAAIGLLGSIALAFIGAGYFAPRAEAYPESLEPRTQVIPGSLPDSAGMAHEWIQDIRNWKAEKEREPIEDMLNNALADLDWYDGSDDATEPEELLQLPSDFDRQSAGWRHDRCNHRSWFRPFQKREGKDCRC